MTSRERVLAALSFSQPDRVPLWDVSPFPRFLENLRAYKQAGAGGDMRDIYPPDCVVLLGDECFFPTRRRIIYKEAGRTIANDGWGRIIETGEDAYFSHTIETLLDDPSRLGDLIFDSPDLPLRYAGLTERAEEARAQGLCVFAKAGGIYNRAHFIRPEEELLCDMLADEGFSNALFDMVAAHVKGMALRTLEHTGADALFIYDDMAATYTPMFSPALFEKYMLPRYAQIITACRMAGCTRFYIHSDGNIGPFIDLFIEAGFQGSHPLEPRSGLALPALRKKYGARFALFGGICNTEILPRGDKYEIKAHLRPLIDLAREGGIVLGMASASEDIAPDIYDYMMQLIYRYGG